MSKEKINSTKIIETMEKMIADIKFIPYDWNIDGTRDHFQNSPLIPECTGSGGTGGGRIMRERRHNV